MINKEVNIILEDKEDKENKLNYKDLIISSVSMEKKSGYSITEMRQIFSVIDSLENTLVGNEIVMKAEDFVYLKSRVSERVWPFVHRDIIKFCDEIKEL